MKENKLNHDTKFTPAFIELECAFGKLKVTNYAIETRIKRIHMHVFIYIMNLYKNGNSNRKKMPKSAQGTAMGPSRDRLPTSRAITPFDSLCSLRELGAGLTPVSPAGAEGMRARISGGRLRDCRRAG